MNKTSEGVLCNYVVTGVHTSGLTNQHKPLRKEEEGKEGPLLMVSGQCGRQLLQYVVIVVCEENCKEEDSGQKQHCSKVDGWWQKHVLGFTLSCFLSPHPSLLLAPLSTTNRQIYLAS